MKNAHPGTPQHVPVPPTLAQVFDDGGIAYARLNDPRERIEFVAVRREGTGQVTVLIKRLDAMLPEERRCTDLQAAVNDLAAHGWLAATWTPQRA